jgi:phosphomannomutase
VSVNNTSMAATLGRHYGIETHEVPVGFKFIGPRMIETGAMMGGEESGGYGFGMHLPERDGIYADLMLLDLFLRERARGNRPVSRAVELFHELAGPSFYRRIDVHFDRPSYEGVKRRVLVGLREAPPTNLAGEPVARTQVLDTGDGFKWFLTDGSWLLFGRADRAAVRGTPSGRRDPRWLVVTGEAPRVARAFHAATPAGATGRAAVRPMIDNSG